MRTTQATITATEQADLERVRRLITRNSDGLASCYECNRDFPARELIITRYYDAHRIECEECQARREMIEEQTDVFYASR